MKWILWILPGLFWIACTTDGKPGSLPAAVDVVPVADSLAPEITPSGKTVETRFAVPRGYVRVPTDSASFGAYLRRLPLKPDSAPVYLYNGRLKNRQDVHCAVVDLDVGSRDLQQCADAVMRLRAEYLYQQRRFADIHFNFTSGFRADYARWRQGDRIRVSGNQVSWRRGQQATPSYAAFRQYLNVVFSYAGTASLERELTPADPAGLQPGDVWIKGGHPGHAVIVLDVAEHPETGERCFLLAQSYMPAQDIHVLRNPAGDSPWYAVPVAGEKLITPEWTFERAQLRRWRG